MQIEVSLASLSGNALHGFSQRPVELAKTWKTLQSLRNAVIRKWQSASDLGPSWFTWMTIRRSVSDILPGDADVPRRVVNCLLEKPNIRGECRTRFGVLSAVRLHRHAPRLLRSATGITGDNQPFREIL